MMEGTVWKETKRIYGVDFQKALKYEGPILPNFVPLKNPAPFMGKMINDFNRGGILNDKGNDMLLDMFLCDESERTFVG